MSGAEEDEKEAEDDAGESAGDEPAGASSQRARVAIAAGAALFLGVIIGVVVLVGASGSSQPSVPTGACFEAWNEDPIAPIQDGQHAYNAHGYRQTLVTRIARDFEIIDEPLDDEPADDPSARCVVIFAAPQPDFEPDFGVRVYDSGRWFGLAVTDKATLDDIARLQAEAVPISNSVLVASGRVAIDD